MTCFKRLLYLVKEVLQVAFQMLFFTKSNSEHLSQGRVGGGSGSGLGEKIRMTFYRKSKKTKNKKKKTIIQSYHSSSGVEREC